MALTFNLSRLSLKTLFHYKSKVKGEHVTSHTVSNPYHAVSIMPGQRACKAARTSMLSRFLSSEAPALPLKTCDAGQCTCRYQHHPDRRAEEPRREEDVGINTLNGRWDGRVERRQTGRGRRITDS